MIQMNNVYIGTNLGKNFGNPKEIDSHQKFKIEFNNSSLRAQKYKNEILQKVASIIDDGYFLNGRENHKLEQNLQYLFVRGHIITLSSGHDALLLALASLNLQPTDEILFPVNSYPTAFPLYLTKAKIIPCDVDENGQLDVQDVMKKITKNTKVIVLVHLYGLIGNLDLLKKIIQEYKLTLIEDCAQSFGSRFKSKLTGTFGDISCFSFYPTKNIGTLGDGGALWTKKKRIYDYILKAKSYGEKKRYFSQLISGHSRLPEIQAGILNVYMNLIYDEFEKRKQIAERYKELIKNIVYSDIRILESHKYSDPVPHLFVVEVKKRDKLRTFLRDKGIETLIHYPHPVHIVPAFVHLKYKPGSFPMAERLAKNILSLPFHPDMTYEQVEFIVDSIKKFYA